MHSDEFRKYMKVVDDNSTENDEDLTRWNRQVKKLFGDDAYITKMEDKLYGTKYQVFAKFYPGAILGLKGQGKSPELAIEKTKEIIDTYSTGGKINNKSSEYKGLEF
jgi:hypothetical protein